MTDGSEQQRVCVCVCLRVSVWGGVQEIDFMERRKRKNKDASVYFTNL